MGGLPIGAGGAGGAAGGETGKAFEPGAGGGVNGEAFAPGAGGCRCMEGADGTGGAGGNPTIAPPLIGVPGLRAGGGVAFFGVWR